MAETERGADHCAHNLSPLASLAGQREETQLLAPPPNRTQHRFHKSLFPLVSLAGRKEESKAEHFEGEEAAPIDEDLELAINSQRKSRVLGFDANNKILFLRNPEFPRIYLLVML
jgi:hypothetical protein